MPDDTTHHPRPGFGYVRTLSQQEELPLLRDHLLRLDRQSRHDRFHGYLDDSFIERYAARCADDGTVIVAYMENGIVRGAAELHPPEQSEDGMPEIAFSVESLRAPSGRRQHPVPPADLGSALEGLSHTARHHRRRQRRRCGRSPASSARIWMFAMANPPARSI